MKKKVGRKHGSPAALGHDPLAWIDAPDEADEAEEIEVETKVEAPVVTEEQEKVVVEESEEESTPDEEMVMEHKDADSESVTLEVKDAAGETVAIKLAEVEAALGPVIEEGPMSLSLEGDLGIAQVEAMHQKLVETLERATEIEIDAGELRQVDTAGVQLLCTFVQQAGKSGVPLTWVALSEAIEKSVDQLGLNSLMGWK
jgi:anti-anti-sigma factor